MTPPGGGRPPELGTCPHCGQVVPAGDFCGSCGAHLSIPGKSGRQRRHSFAASPGEHVLHLSAISTFFPHLQRSRHTAFRWALAGGLLAALILAAFDLFAPSAAVATVLLPALYLLYTYEARVWRSEPWLAVGGSFLVGAILGIVVTSTLEGLVSSAALRRDAGVLLWELLVVPLVSQAAMLAGPLLLLRRRAYDEVLDGIALGVASALGFTFAQALAALAPVLSPQLVGEGVAQDWALVLLQHGVLAGMINAATTGAICAALWLRRIGLRQGAWSSRWLGLGGTLAAALTVRVLLELIAQLPSLLLVVAGWALVAAAAAVYLRLAVHHALLAESAAHAIGPDGPCPECGRLVPAMSFCPSCGAARRASTRPEDPTGGQTAAATPG